MAVYRETYTKPLPDGAELFTRKGERFASWVDGKGRKRTAKVTTPDTGNHAGTDRLLIEARTYTAKYRNGAGHVVKVATGCKTKDAAEAVLAGLQTRADKVRCGSWSAAEDSVLDWQATAISEHVTAYLEHQRGKRGKGGRARINPTCVANAEYRLGCVVAGCRFERLRDLGRVAVERWAARQEAAGMSPSTLNGYLQTVTAFGNWCIETGRIVANPFGRLPKRDAKADRRRVRRAMTDNELRRLLKVAGLRPLAEYGRETVRLAGTVNRENKRSRRTWTKAPLTLDTLDAAVERGRAALHKRPDLIAELEHRGRERALIYKSLVLTGLRKAELDALTVGHLELDGPMPYAVLDAADEKAGRGAEIPLRGDLANDLRQWLADKLEAVRSDARRCVGASVPLRLPAETPLFDVPAGLIRILDRDLKAAGIPKSDDRGRTVDVHAMRHTFGSHLSKGGVAPRTAQAAMRHASIDLTMNVYTDPRLLDVAGALDVLPALPLDDPTEAERQRATGTTDQREPDRRHSPTGQTGAGENAPRSLVPMLVPNPGNCCTERTTPDKAPPHNEQRSPLASDAGDKRCALQSTADVLETMGLEPTTFALRTRRSPN